MQAIFGNFFPLPALAFLRYPLYNKNIFKIQNIVSYCKTKGGFILKPIDLQIANLGILPVIKLSHGRTVIIPCIGNAAKLHYSRIALLTPGHQMAGNLGSLPEQIQQDSLSHGIKGSGVAYLTLPEPLQPVGALRRRHAPRLINYQKTMQLFHKERDITL